jgi:adenylate kinase
LIGIDGMIFLADDTEAIADRRRQDPTRRRPVRSAGDLGLIQADARKHATAICRILGVPLHEFRPNEHVAIARLLCELGIN